MYLYYSLKYRLRIANLSSPNSEAIDLVNVIRRRAGIEDKNQSDVNSLEAFNNLIPTERSQKYWGENGQYRSDLVRSFIGIWGANYYTDYFGTALVSDSSWADRRI